MRNQLKALFCHILILVLWLSMSPAQAQILVRDTEIEDILSDMALPLLQAARLEPESVTLRLIQDPSLNAFVTANRTIYIHSGLVERLDRATMLQSVIAHEIGHIVGGHAATRTIAAQQAQNAQTAGLLAGVMLGIVAGPTAGVAAVSGAQGLAEQSYFKTSRTDETAADQTGVRLLDLAGIDPQASLDTMDLFAGQELLPAERQDPYARSHPYFSERRTSILALTQTALSRGMAEDTVLQDRYERMQAKIFGFVSEPADVLAATRQATDIKMRLARAIALQRYPDASQSLTLLKLLQAERPDDVYIRELSAQFSIENGNLAAGIEGYRAALAAMPDAPLIRAALGRALVAIDDAAATAEAIPLLETSLQNDPGVPGAAEALARAYSAQGNDAMAALTTADMKVRYRQYAEALRFAQRARALLENGTVEWLRADDLVNDLSRYSQNKTQ